MTWERKTKYYETNGTHNVAAVKVLKVEDSNLGKRMKDWRGRDKGDFPNVGGELVWQFEAWRKGRHGGPATWLGLFDTAAEARAFCEGESK